MRFRTNSICFSNIKRNIFTENNTHNNHQIINNTFIRPLFLLKIQDSFKLELFFDLRLSVDPVDINGRVSSSDAIGIKT